VFFTRILTALRYEIAERFRKSGKGKLVLLILSDHDPDGEEIAQSFARSLRDDFDIIADLHPVKVALTEGQVRDLRLPPKLEAKASSSNYLKFANQYGTVAHELEAVEPAELQRILRDAINQVLDRDAFHAELDAEAEDAARLGVVRKDILEHARSRGVF
jgi:5S rRNA maturation endonuclease (ribonuclease M5)